MTTDGKSISVAAHLAGFAGQSHFTKAFRRVTGNNFWALVARCSLRRRLSPGSYRIFGKRLMISDNTYVPTFD
jgi:hypothetical protein